MAKIAKTGDRKKVMDTQKSTDCPKCSKPTWRRIHFLLGLRLFRKALSSIRTTSPPSQAGLLFLCAPQVIGKRL